MDRDDFIFALKEQYAEEIREAYLECEHDGGESMDYEQLSELLGVIWRSAKAEGLSHSDFDELVRVALPEFSDQIEWSDRAA